MPTSMIVSMNDWDKFNPRTDSKSHTWFRFQNNFFTKCFTWTPEQQRLFIYLCCLCSQERKAEVVVELDLASALLKRKPDQIINDLKTLESKSYVTLSNSKLLDVTSKDAVPTYIQTDTTDRQTRPSFDFEKIYEKHARKEGKKKGIEICQKTITTQELYDSLSRAADNYNTKVRRERTELQFIKQFSTFMNCWTDYKDEPKSKHVTPLYPQDTVKKIQQREAQFENQRTMTPDQLKQLKEKFGLKTIASNDDDEPKGAA